MAQVIIDSLNLTNIADAIRDKNGTQATYKPNQMADAISDIPSQKEEQEKTLTLGAATPSAVTPDTNKVLSQVNVSLDSSVIKAENIAKDVVVLGITGTHEGGITPTGNIEVTKQTGTDVTNYATASVKSGAVNTPATTKQQSAPTFTQSGNVVTANVAATSVDVTPNVSTAGWISSGTAGTVTMSANSAEYTIPVDTLDNTIISGAAFEEATGDYAWRSTVQVPAGYHNAQTLTKEFSSIFPAPETEGTADKMLLGYELFDHDGKKITGTMANNSAVSATISTQGDSYTIPEGYHNGSGTVTANITAGSATTPATTKQQSAPTISVDSTGLITANVAATSVDVTPTVSAGYVNSGTAGTITMSANSAASQLSTQAAATITPSTTSQTAVEAGKYTTGAVTVAAMPTGTLGAVTATKGTVSNNSISVTPQVAAGTAGYNAMTAYSGTAVTVSASELVSGTTNITTTASTDVTNSQYAQVVDANLVAANIITGKTILGVAGSAVVPSGSTTITTNTTTDVTNYASVITNVPQAVPIEVSTDAGMTAVLTSANIGKCYKFTGTTSTYTNGDLYIPNDIPTLWQDSYKIYESDGTTEIASSNWTVSGLANAYYYSTDGGITKNRVGGRIFHVNYSDAGSVDRFYVYDNTTHSTTDGTTTWSATDGLVSSQYWGYYGTSTGCTTNTIGSGKTNTNTVLALGVPTDYTPNIWGYISACRSTSLNGCTDWYIGSTLEMDQLKNSGLQSAWFTSNYIWSSVENLDSPTYSSLYWRYYGGYWSDRTKTNSLCCVAVRSF